MHGEDGGKGNIISRAVSTASKSTPANTVTKRSGVCGLLRLILAPGRAFPAAQPQTEFTITRVVPSAFRASLTAWAVYSSSNPASTKSNLMGRTNSSGYIILFFRKHKNTKSMGLLGRHLLDL
jgi:hypothetical protein